MKNTSRRPFSGAMESVRLAVLSLALLSGAGYASCFGLESKILMKDPVGGNTALRFAARFQALHEHRNAQQSIEINAQEKLTEKGERDRYVELIEMTTELVERRFYDESFQQFDIVTFNEEHKVIRQLRQGVSVHCAEVDNAIKTLPELPY